MLRRHALIFLIIVFISPRFAIADQNFLCVIEGINGFQNDGRSWERQHYQSDKKFVVKLNGSIGKFYEFGKSVPNYDNCNVSDGYIECRTDYGRFSMDSQVKNFVIVDTYDYVIGKYDDGDIFIMIGKCSPF